MDRHTTLSIVRMGTSGALIPDIEVGDIVVSHKAIGLDNLMHYYNYAHSIEDEVIQEKVVHHLGIPSITPYVVSASPILIKRYKNLGHAGITVTAPGFYGPQGRSLLAKAKSSTFLDDIVNVTSGALRVTNLEMESSAILGLAQLLGHKAISLNAILANRATGVFSEHPKKEVENLISKSIEYLCRS